MLTRAMALKYPLRSYCAYLCSYASFSWLLYLWVFTCPALTNSVFTGVQETYQNFPDMSITTWWVFIDFSMIVSGLFIVDTFIYGNARLTVDRRYFYICLYFVTSIISIIVNREYIRDNEPFFGIIKMLVPFAFAVMFVQKFDRRHLYFICMICTVFALMNIPISFVELYINSDAPTTSHISGVFSDRNLFSRYLIVVYTFLLITFLSAPRKRIFSWKVFLLFTIFICISLQFSRSGYILFLFVNFFILLRYDNPVIKRFLPLAFIVVTLLFGSLIALRIKTEKMDINNASDIGRIATTKAGINMVMASPVFGVGYNMSGQRFVEFQDIHYPGLRNMVTIHNIYLNVMAEQGIVGLIAYLTFNFSLIAGLYKAGKGMSFREQQWILFAFTTLATYLIHGLFYHSMDYDGMYWLIIALCFIAIRDSEQRQRTGSLTGSSKYPVSSPPSEERLRPS